MIFLHIIYFITSLYIIVITVFLTTLTVAAYFFKKKTNPLSSPLKISIIIPAHNEELQIEETINSIYDSNYSKDLYSINVIADNCEDNTASIARMAGALAFERRDPENRGKGQALDWFLKTYKKKIIEFDAIAIIDADTLLHPDFLLEVSSSLSHQEVKVVQGYYGASNPDENWRTALLSAALNVFNHLRPAGRIGIGGTAGLKGNGMAFRSEILLKYGWPAYSIVEDIEFSIKLLRDGIIVHYNPDANVYGEMAIENKQAESQRKRWEGGRFQAFKKYALPLLWDFFKQHKIQYLDGFLELFTPPLSILVLGQGVLLVLAFFFYPFMLPVFILCLILITIYVFSGLFLKKSSLKVWVYLLFAPLFILWKIPIYFKLFLSKRADIWERTQRKTELKRNR